MTTPPDPHPWTLRSRRGGMAHVRADGVLRLAAEQEWILTGPEEVVAEVARALPRHAEALGEGILLLAFGNAVGMLDLPHVGRVEVRSGKWGEEAFAGMLEDVARISGGLPFSAGETPLLRFSLRPSPEPPVPYHAFLYLRHVLGPDAPRPWRLLPALELVVRDPHRRWERSVRRVPLAELSRVDPATAAGIFQSRLEATPGDRFRPESGVGRLRERLHGHLPVQVSESQVRSRVDTPENRFVLKFLDDARRVVAQVGRAAEARSDAFGRRVAREAEECSAVLERIRRAPLWREVGRMDHLPISSTVLRSRRGYREVLAHWIRFRRSADLPLSEKAVRAVVEAKDIASLYELWCFFQVVDATKEILGAPQTSGRVSSSVWQVDVAPEFRVEWKGVRLVYNGTFTRGRLGLRYAYSSPMIPDIVLEDRRHAEAEVHVLDAKFRVQRTDRTRREVLRYKTADLHKMHTYRDAVPAVRSAVVLYPGEVSRFHTYPDGEGGEALLDGVGAIPLDPAERSGQVKAWLRSILARNPEETDSGAGLQAAAEQPKLGEPPRASDRLPAGWSEHSR